MLLAPKLKRKKISPARASFTSCGLEELHEIGESGFAEASHQPEFGVLEVGA
jgi:hypothetical protein